MVDRCVSCKEKIDKYFAIIIEIGDIHTEYYCSFTCFTEKEKNKKYKEFELIMKYAYPII